MRVSRIASVLLIASVLVLSATADDEVEDEGDVVVLGEADFDSKVNEGTWLIKFMAPSCGFCKMLAPDWRKLAKEVKEDGLPFTVAKFNVRDSRDVSAKFGIGKLPGIKLIKDGKVYTLPDARTGRTVDQYIEYALETFEEVEAAEIARIAKETKEFEDMEARSDVVKLTLDNFEEVTSEGDWLISFYGPKCGYCKKLEPTWEELGTLVNTDASMGFKVAKFDAAAGFKYTSQFKANPWPAIKLIKAGEAYTFPDPRNFEHKLENYVAFAQAGWESTGGDAIALEYVEDQRKRAARKAKYAEKTKGQEAPKVHEDL